MFDEYLEWGRLEHGFFVSVATERYQMLVVAFSCNGHEEAVLQTPAFKILIKLA